MIFDIEFFQWTTGTDSTVIRRHSAVFADLEAAKRYALENAGFRDSPEEADGFRVVENGMSLSEFVIKLPRKPMRAGAR